MPKFSPLSATESRLRLSLHRRVWGSESNDLLSWKENDYLIIFVGTRLAALAGVAGLPVRDDKRLWDEGVFPLRVGIKTIVYLWPDDRLPVPEAVISEIEKEWGQAFQEGVTQQRELPASAGQVLVQQVKNRGPSCHMDLFREMDQARSTPPGLTRKQHNTDQCYGEVVERGLRMPSMRKSWFCQKCKRPVSDDEIEDAYGSVT